MPLCFLIFRFLCQLASEDSAHTTVGWAGLYVIYLYQYSFIFGPIPSYFTPRKRIYKQIQKYFNDSELNYMYFLDNT